MKAIRATGGGVTVVDVDEPPGTGQLLDVKSASICSSDFIYIAVGSGQILGHEVAGVLQDGTPVVLEALFGCEDCDQCRRGHYNLCPTHPERAIGYNTDGGMAEQYRAPAGRLVPLPPGLDVRDACIVEPASVSWHALRLAGTGPDTSVAVVGAGALGLLAAAGARRQGASEVVVEARHPHQVEAAERLGATVRPNGRLGATVRPAERLATVGPDGRYDVVVEAAGNPASLARAIELVAPGGTVVVLGVHRGPVEVDWSALFHREARLIPSMGYCRHDTGREMDDAAAMLAADPEIARVLITHRFGLADAGEAFRVARDKSSGAIRVVIEP